MKKKICFLLSTLLCFLSFVNFPVFGQGYSRTITGTFTNMDIFLNNIPLYLSEEPFFYEGEVYLPLNNLARQMYFSTDYDETTQKIAINTNGTLNHQTSQNFSVEALQRDYSIFALSQKIESLGGEVSKTSSNKIDAAADIVGYLENRYGYIQGVPVTFDFRNPRDNDYLLYISFAPKDRTAFEGIARRSVEYWLEDIFYAIREFYDFKAEVEGFVRSGAPSYNTYVTFETKNDTLAFNFRADNESSTGPIQVDRRSLEYHLEKNLSSYHNINFDYTVRTNQYDINLIVYFNDRDFYQWGSSRRKNYLERLKREINSFEEGLYVYGTVIDDAADEEILYFVFDDEGTINFHDNLSDKPSTVQSRREEEKSTPQGTILHRSMNVWFLYPQLEVDGRSFSLLKEIFLMGDEVYIALSDLADALYWAFDYHSEKNQLHILDNNYYSQQNTFLEATLLFEKRAEEERLYENLASIKEQAEKQKLLPSHYQNIETSGRMQSYLKDYFEDFEGIETSIGFSDIGEHSYRLRITYPASDYVTFKNIRRNTIEGWIEDMFHAIKELYDPYAEISGSIRSTPYDENNFTYITFDVEDRELLFDFEDHENQATSYRNLDPQRLERALDKNLWRFTGVSFRYEVLRNRSNIDINAYFSNTRFYDWDIFEKMDYLKELLEEAEDVYDNLTVSGRVIDDFRNKTALDFSFKDGKIRSYDLLRDVEDYLDKNYGRFTYNNNTFTFTYKIHEKNDNTFDIKLEGDFFQEENQWRNIAGNDTGLQAFEAFLVDALAFISNFWEADVQGEVVDKAYSPVMIKTVP
ncbi:hypothetical protein [Clostridium formicaceticum]|uniref:Copper amine oxidase-like N-terminal domain-containing protein n=1 Tax=Clostridium formicaceticum TaxID=1497 RepID=A0AAC9RGW6_9CLOT|nr:hypothetical protein [Clostridium formicaceticum]AOY75519.1 hypothetical protein BJL90_06180 [Clostridium formicaceticum]ARE85811.1 hypothetical protein CLFO_01270 [Clostridium formicaceticum]